MDIVTHGVVGYAIGGTYGAVGAVLPDVALLSIERLKEPTKLYKTTHTVPSVIPFLFIDINFGLGYLSHLALDLFTHRSEFGIRFWYGKDTFKGVGEWEFFDDTWWLGIFFSLLVIGLCYAL